MNKELLKDHKTLNFSHFSVLEICEIFLGFFYEELGNKTLSGVIIWSDCSVINYIPPQYIFKICPILVGSLNFGMSDGDMISTRCMLCGCRPKSHKKLASKALSKHEVPNVC